MLDKYVPYGQVPFWWLRLNGLTQHYVGQFDTAQEVYLDPANTDDCRLAYFIDSKDNVIGVSAMGKPNAALVYQEAMQ